MIPISPALSRQFDTLVASGRLGHGYILHGPPKGFPAQAALYLALAALCEQTPPCQTCAICRQVLAHDHPDIRVLAADTTPVDTIRQMVRDIQLGARIGHRLVVCILHADQMTPQAANAFLKTLEEPPKGVTLILATHTLAQLLPTIRSRCTSIACPSVPEADQRAWLDKTGHTYTGPISDSLISYVDKTGTFPQHIIPLSTLAQYTATERLSLAETLAKDKAIAKIAMHQWLEESVQTAQHTGDMRPSTLLISHIKNSHYTLNTRLQMEALVFALQTL